METIINVSDGSDCQTVEFSEIKIGSFFLLSGLLWQKTDDGNAYNIDNFEFSECYLTDQVIPIRLVDIKYIISIKMKTAPKTKKTKIKWTRCYNCKGRIYKNQTWCQHCGANDEEE